MNNYISIGIGTIIILWYYIRKKNEIPHSWLTPSNYLYITPVASLTFENDVMQYRESIMREGQNNKIEPAIIASIIAKESKGIPSVINGRFLGLMQFGLSEARAMGYTFDVQTLMNPKSNIYWGSKYLAYCIKQKNGNLFKGISAYNTGQVESSSTPYNQDYVDEVKSYVPRFRYLLAQSYPGYATVFPPETWLKTDVIYA